MSEESRPENRPDDGFRAERPDSLGEGPVRRRRSEYGDEPPPSSGSPLKIVLIIVGVVALLGCLVIGGVAGMLYLATSKVRQAAGRIQQANNHKQVALAMHNYADDHQGALPPVAMKTKSGKPGLSWRVALLPYMEHNDLYRQFKIDEPWDHPDNLKLASRMPPMFAADPKNPGDK